MEQSGADFDLAGVLAPMDVETFQREYWEKRPLLIKREHPLYYRELLSLKGVDEILSTSSLTNDIRIVEESRETPLSSLMASENGAAGLEQVYAQYREGSSIILQGIHQRWKPLRKLCATLSAEASASFQVNAYLTPRNAQALGIHYDTHDVFVLQIEGSKHWRLYDSPVRLPLRGQPYQRDKHSSAPLLQEFDLDAGDALYLPRGFVHEALSTDSTSLHLTVGVHPILWAEVFLAAVESVIERDPRFRESLPPGFARDDALGRVAEAQKAELLNLLFAEVASQPMIMDAIERASLARQPTLEGHLLDLEAAPLVNLSTPVRRRPETQWRLSVECEEVSLLFHGKKLRMPSYVEADLRFIGETNGQFTGASLPGQLDDEGRIVLIRRLLREGFLTTSPPFRSTMSIDNTSTTDNLS
jgi:ribosomal protein L16 Arg81 hydroxylase